MQRLLGGDQLVTIARDMQLTDITALYAAIGENHVSAQSIVQKLVAQLGGVEGAERGHRRAIRPRPTDARRAAPLGGDAGVVVRGVSDVWVKLARCCTPVPGDEILGFVTRGGGVSVHRHRLHQRRRRCSEQPERLVEVEWAPSATRCSWSSIQVEALDRHRLLSDVTRVLADERVNILSAIGHHQRRPGGGQPVHLRDGRAQAPRPSCCAPCAASKASTTSTASSSPKRTRRPLS